MQNEYYDSSFIDEISKKLGLQLLMGFALKVTLSRGMSGFSNSHSLSSQALGSER